MLLLILKIKAGGMGVKMLFVSIGWSVAAVGNYSIPATALGVSVIALLYTAWSLRRQSRTDLTAQLYKQIEDLERQLSRVESLLDEAQKELARVRDENIQLMRRLVADTRKE